MKTIVTTEYPTRYEAFANPKIWIEQENTNLRQGGFEYAIYDEPVTNILNPHLTDGIHISITSYQGKSYLVECLLTEPIKGRKQHSHTKRCTSYEIAKKEALKWLPRMQRLIKRKLEMMKTNLDAS